MKKLIEKIKFEIVWKLLNGSRRIPRFFSSLLETIYIKNDKEMYETIMSTNKNSSFVKEDELKW